MKRGGGRQTAAGELLSQPLGQLVHTHSVAHTLKHIVAHTLAHLEVPLCLHWQLTFGTYCVLFAVGPFLGLFAESLLRNFTRQLNDVTCASICVKYLQMKVKIPFPLSWNKQIVANLCLYSLQINYENHSI